MLSYAEYPVSEAVEITVDGKVTRGEFDEVAEKLAYFIDRHGHVRLLEVVRDFGGMQPSVFWSDVKFSLRHLNNISRCAVVTHQYWFMWMATAARTIAPGEVRCFALEDEARARGWLLQHMERAENAA